MQRLLHTESFTQRSCLHADAFVYRSFLDADRRFYTEAFFMEKLLHRSSKTQELFCNEIFTHRIFDAQKQAFYTQTLLHTEAFTQKLFRCRRSQRLLHRSFFTGAFYTEMLLHTAAFTQNLLRPRRFCTQKLLDRSFLDADAFAHRRF